MFTDPRVTYEFGGLTAAGVASEDVQVEATAAIMGRLGRLADETDDASVAFDAVSCPAGAQLDSFGVVLTEALTNANATHCTVALKVLDKEGGSTTTVAVITLPKDSTEIVTANLRPSTATAAQAVAAGARILSSDADIPYTVPQGGKFYVEVTQAAGAAGGAFKAFVIARQNGMPDPTAASPITHIAS